FSLRKLTILPPFPKHEQVRARHAVRASRRIRRSQDRDLKTDERKDILQERQDRALLSITLAGGDPAGNLGGPLWWQDQFEVSKGSRRGSRSIRRTARC